MKKSLIDRGGLKIIAISAMLIDHIGYEFTAFMPDVLYWTFRGIGRIAFPIFCFMLAEGILHTSNKFKYCLRLFVFALISEIPFNLMSSTHLFYPKGQNVLFTLFIAAVSIITADICLRQNDKILGYISAVFILTLGSLAAHFLRSDYGIIGIIYPSIFFFLHRDRTLSCIVFAFFSFLYSLSHILDHSNTFGYITLFSIVSTVPILLYSGKNSVSGKFQKYFFYIFYPLHMLIIYLIYVTI